MNLANRLTILRILLVPVFIASLLYFTAERPYLRAVAVIVFAVACITDGLDGYLARKMRQKTQLGSYIDPIADKLLLLSGYLSLSLIPNLPDAMRVPAWVTLVVLSRDVVIVVGSAVIFIATGTLKAEPLFVSKITTVMQMASLFFSLLGFSWELRIVSYILTGGLTILSGILYIGVGGRSFREA